MNYKSLLERTKSLTQRNERINKDQEYILDNYISMVTNVAFLIVILGIDSIIKNKASVVINIIFYLTLLIILFWYYRNKYRKMEDKLKYFSWDFYSVDSRRNILIKEIDEFQPTILNVNTHEEKECKSIIQVIFGDLSYTITPTSIHYEVSINGSFLAKFDIKDEAITFATERIRTSIKQHLGIL